MSNQRRFVAVVVLMILVAIAGGLLLFLPDDAGQARDEWGSHLDQWKIMDISHYTITVQHVEAIWSDQTVTIEVRNREVTNCMLDDEPCSEDINGAKYTVESLFSEARRRITTIEDDSGYSLTITYNKEYHYPERISSSHDDIADSHSLLKVTDFEVMNP